MSSHLILKTAWRVHILLITSIFLSLSKEIKIQGPKLHKLGLYTTQAAQLLSKGRMPLYTLSVFVQLLRHQIVDCSMTTSSANESHTKWPHSSNGGLSTFVLTLWMSQHADYGSMNINLAIDSHTKWLSFQKIFDRTIQPPTTYPILSIVPWTMIYTSIKRPSVPSTRSGTKRTKTPRTRMSFKRCNRES